VQGYQFTCATRRSYWLHWDTPYQLSPETFSLHKPDLMNATHGWLYLTAKWPQVWVLVQAYVSLCLAACWHFAMQGWFNQASKD
jgi:hypothetical protein